jgi:hypothetical protein
LNQRIPLHLLSLLVFGCGPTAAVAPQPALPREIVFVGMCDASGSVQLGSDRFIMADDEDNALRVYDVTGGPPLSKVDLSPFLELGSGESQEFPETDLEAATTVGDKAVWISSHARSSSGNESPARLRMFATTVSGTPVLHGHAYTHLREDLVTDARFEKFNLRDAITRAPAAPGGFNIEGMTATPDGGVIIGLRNPVSEGRAIIVPLTNPLEVVEGKPPRFGDPITIDLGGRGVRALSWWRGQYIIAAGSPTHGRDLAPALYRWDGVGTPQRIEANLGTLNVEAFHTPEDRDAILVLSDDGTQLVDGTKCKHLTDETKKSFRAAWITPF